MSEHKKTPQNTHQSDIKKYAVPAILSGLIGALYNIIDQIFIGHIIGVEGNAATNIAFPLVTMNIALMLFIGIGGTANFSISKGKKDLINAEKYVGAVLLFAPLLGLLLTITTLLFTENLILFFGATEHNFDLSLTYVSIVALGYPFFITSESATKLIRADGSPKYSMYGSFIGAFLNCIFNPIFMIVFDLGIAGAAYATVLGQILSCLFVLAYFPKFKTFKLTKNAFQPTKEVLKRISTLGISPAINQIAMALTQIVLNNSLTYYSANSIYGTEIPLACVGIITKVNSLYMAVMIGIAQGAQPLLGFNYGAKNYKTVKEIYLLCSKYATTLSILAFLIFQLFPRQIISIFGTGDELYYQFGILYFRSYMLMTFLNSIQPITSNFFTAIGKPLKSLICSLARQLFFLIPFILILPNFFGLNGILYAGPLGDILTFFITLTLIKKELKELDQKILVN